MVEDDLADVLDLLLHGGEGHRLLLLGIHTNVFTDEGFVVVHQLVDSGVVFGFDFETGGT